MTLIGPDFSFEREHMASGARWVVGIDEVGRGPIAGPVTAAAIILDPENIPDGLNDSKKLSIRRRERLFAEILETAVVGVAHASVDEIDELNILRASHLAMERACSLLSISPSMALIDGNLVPKGLRIPSVAIVRGDARSQSIAAASIVAKVTRDKIMVDLEQQYPGYDWAKNAGYPTKAHLEALRNIGVTPHHRRSFKPVHNMLYQEKS
ncbi:ribonuclease HII [Pelagovum sp. HNIBRBA483]|uniref:ribonuclease HII n=1 Tax=Pelagovum sp. HNIBRBA483 TaxID=3233341 RepID=UPI0034A285AC